jgi:hypothetical protein
LNGAEAFLQRADRGSIRGSVHQKIVSITKAMSSNE